MREIKFRAWDKDGCRIMEWWGSLFKTNAQWFKSLMYFGRDDTVLMQFTGLHDSTKWESLSKDEQQKWLDSGKTKEQWNGKKIYEGDILQAGGNKALHYEVVFRNGSFAEIHRPDDRWIHYFKDMVDSKGQICDEVIGNIYENQNLLKE